MESATHSLGTFLVATEGNRNVKNKLLKDSSGSRPERNIQHVVGDKDDKNEFVNVKVDQDKHISGFSAEALEKYRVKNVEDKNVSGFKHTKNTVEFSNHKSTAFSSPFNNKKNILYRQVRGPWKYVSNKKKAN